jgi:dual specificity phosphatase 12
MASVDIPASLLASELTADNEPAQKIKSSKDVGKENATVATKQEYKKPANRKRKLPLQESEESRPQKRAKIEKSEPILPAKLDPLVADLKAEIKDLLFKSDLHLHLSTEDTKAELAMDTEILQSPDKLKRAVKAETPTKTSTPLKSEPQNVKIEQQNLHPFDIQQGIEISKITEESRLFLGNADVANNSEWLLSANVTHIVNVASEVPNYYEKIFFNDDEFQFTYRKESFNDSEHENIMPKLHDLTDFIKQGLNSGSVLVHCKMGQSRSVSIIYAYLIKHGGMTLQLAKRFIEEELKVLTKLNNGFKKQLMDFEKEIRNVSEASHDFFVLPKRISTPPAQFRTLDHFSQKSRSLNSSPATPQRRVNSASPRKTPTARKTNSARKAKANTNKLLRAAVGVPSVKDMLERQAHHNPSSTQHEHSDTANNHVNSSDNNNNNNHVNSSSKSDSDSAHSDSENVVPSLPEGVRISLKLSGVKYK